MSARILLLASVIMLICGSAFATSGECGFGPEGKGEEKGVFSCAVDEALVKDGVKEISYDQFMHILGSGEKYVLLDVRPPDSYHKGHITGAALFPADTINNVTAEKRLSKDDHIIVYCGNFKCTASTHSARKLSDLGYNVVDYKGGLEEWHKKGNKPTKFEGAFEGANER